MLACYRRCRVGWRNGDARRPPQMASEPVNNFIGIGLPSSAADG